MIKIYIIIKQRIFFFYLFRKQQIIKMIKNYAEQKAIKNLLNYEYFSYEKHTCINFWPDIEIFPLFPLFQLYHDYDINNQNSFLVSKFMGIWFCNFKTCQMNSSHKNNFTVSISSCIRSNTNIYLEGMSCIFRKIPPLQWTSLNPQTLIEFIEDNHAERIPKVEVLKEIMEEVFYLIQMCLIWPHLTLLPLAMSFHGGIHLFMT